MFTEESISELKSRIQLLPVVEETVTMKPRGSSYIGLCPFHNEKTPSFYVDPKTERYKCFGCGKSGDAFQWLQDKDNMSYTESVRYLAAKFNVELIEEGKQVYVKPEWKNKTEISSGVVKWFEKRGISQNTLIKAKVTSGKTIMPTKEGMVEMPVIQFNYFRDGELVNIKSRGQKKEFKLEKGAELILYNLDSLKGKKEAFIVEGEPDVLSLIEAGYDNETMGVVSVPNGASEHRNNLIYINNSYEHIKHIEKWHIALDNDSNGRKLREELADRLGKDKCDYIEWKEKKDANEVLVKYGIQGIIDCCSKPIKFPLEGAYTISDFSYEIEDLRANGLDKGVSVGLQDFPLRFIKGYITVITGISGHGKSEFTDDICLRLTIRQNWKGAFYSPENKPTQLHYSKMASRIVGKAWEGENALTKKEEQQVREYLDKKIWFIKPEKDFSLTSVLKSIRELQARYGLDYFVIDAWNKLEHKENDTNYIGRALDELALFCETYNIHCFLVAHPIKPEIDKKTGLVKVPQLYNISGSNNFNNKADNGISVYLDRNTGICTVHILKVKFKHWGWIASPEYLYDKASGRYYKIGYPDFKNWITGEINTNSNELPLEIEPIFNAEEPAF